MSQNPHHYMNFPSVARQTTPNDHPSTVKPSQAKKNAIYATLINVKAMNRVRPLNPPDMHFTYARPDMGKDQNTNSTGYGQGSSSKATRGLSNITKFNRLRKGGSEQDEKFVNENQQRQEQELDDLKQLLTNREREIDELKRLLRDSDEKSNKLKRRNEKLQGYIDNDESTLGHQQSDDVVLSQFRSLILGIKSWSNRWCGSSSQDASSRSQDGNLSIHWEEDHEIIQNIFPWNQSKEDFMYCLSDVRQKRKFVRGWIGLHIAKTIFRTLPSTRYPRGSGVDIWIPDDLRSHVNEVEIALLNSGKLRQRIPLIIIARKLTFFPRQSRDSE